MSEDENPPRVGQPAGMPSPSDIRALLIAYHQVIEDAKALPIVLFMRSRPGAGIFLRMRWPRHTIGISRFVARHISRTISDLGRQHNYHIVADGQSDESKQVADMLESFAKTLPSGRVRNLVIASFAIALLVVQPVLLALAGEASLFMVTLADDFNAEELDALRALLASVQAFLTSLSLQSFSELANDLMGARLVDVALIVMGAAAIAYILLRPLITSFRIKRALFNSSPLRVDVRNTSASWHVPRAVGLYELERDIFRAYRARTPIEAPFDLIVSLLGAALTCWIVISFYVAEDIQVEVLEPIFAELSASATAGTIAVVLILGCARVLWLLTTWKARRTHAPDEHIPGATRLVITHQTVELRAPIESGAWFTIGLTAPFVWYRLSRELASLRRERRASRGQPEGRPHPVLYLIGALAQYLPYVSSLICATHLVSLYGLAYFPRRRTMTRFAVTSLGVTAGLSILALAWKPVDFWSNFVLFLASLASGLIFCAQVQSMHNEVALLFGVDLKMDIHAAVNLPPLRFNPPPGWPKPPPGFSPDAGWHPDPTWPPPPDGWCMWERE